MYIFVYVLYLLMCSKEIRRRSSGLSFFLLNDSWRLISISTSLFSQGGDAENVGARKVRLRKEKNYVTCIVVKFKLFITLLNLLIKVFLIKVFNCKKNSLVSLLF